MDEAVWRDAGNGALEVATIKDGRLERRLVHDDGSDTLIESAPSTRLRTLGLLCSFSGFAVNLATLVGGFASKDGWAHFPPLASLVLLGFGTALMIVGALAQCRDELGSRLNSDEPSEAWNVVPWLGSWAPRTTDQLLTVEALAEAADGSAYVRNHQDGTVEAVTKKSRVLKRYLVHESGNATLVESGRAPFGSAPGAWARRTGGDTQDWTGIRTRAPDD